MIHADRRNYSGAVDSTAHAALQSVLDERENQLIVRKDQTVRLIRMMADIAGFDIVGRFTLRDRETGQVFK